ncbi:hypothetical protein MSAN_00078200 [Mycena sanguinolenta]|uniref:Uncharacterized protein n=1 Tax=Mycena sanguinolenta TaxID=230812 RepID=A0A8H7DJK6_9AGAR|nr:hypothetical protein MSAN_00078200 [Mycena sanguinolenta]
MNRLQRGPPSYRNRRAPGQWSWDDFNPKSRPEKRLGSSNADSVEAYETNLCNGWNSQALSLFPDTKCRILQIDVLPEKFEVYSETATLSKQSPDPDRMRLGKYLFIDRLSKGVLEGLGAKYNIDVDYFRACFDLSVSHSVDVSRTNVSKKPQSTVAR